MLRIMERFYKGRVALNILANSIENAKEVFNAADGYALVGVLSKNYSSLNEAINAMTDYGEKIEGAVSIGLGAGDSRQAAMVAEIAKYYAGSHINQVFPAVGSTRANLGEKEGWINSLVSPVGKIGYVKISTGFYSGQSTDPAIVPIKSAIALVRDMGGNALKYFPMNGLDKKEEFIAVAEACGEEKFALEPTGGIDKENFEEILRICLDASVPYIIPHVYSSIINKSTKLTEVEDVKFLAKTMKRLTDSYE